MDEDKQEKVALDRYAAIRRLIESDGLSRADRRGLARELAAEHGCAPQTVWRWAQRFRAGGYRLEALLPPAHRRDRGKLSAFPPKVLAEAVRLREEEPRRSTATLIELIRRLHPEEDVRIVRPTLDRHLRRLNKTRRHLAQPSRPLRRFRKTVRNALWIADFCFPDLSWRDGDEVRRAILLVFLDHRTRKVTAGGFVPNRQAVVVEEMFKQAITTHGRPEALYVDHGAELVGSLIKTGCLHLGIRHIAADVGEPEGRGVVERFFRFFQDSFVPEMAAKAMIPTLPELNRFWDAWLEVFYHNRPHSGLDGLTPRQAWEQDRTPVSHVDPLTLDGAFLLREMRRVDKTALVSWQGRKYLCEDALTQQRVEIRYHPERHESVQIWRDGRFLQLACRYLPPENVPHQPKTAPRPTPQQSLLDELDREHQAYLRQQLERRPVAAVPHPAMPFTEAAAAALLAATLGRNIEGRELDWLAESWRRAGGWDATLTEKAVRLFAARFGTGRHLAYYLEFIQEAHLRTRRKEDTPHRV